MTKLLEGEPLKVEDLNPTFRVVRYEYPPDYKPRGPSFRSCWVCNPAHEHLKQSAWLVCFICGKTYRLGVVEE